LIEQLGGYQQGRNYSWEEVMEINALSWKNAGLDVTPSVYDPASHWMGGKIENWIRFFHVDPGDWRVEQTGGTAWIAKRPFSTLSELEKHLPEKPVYEEVREWYEPLIRQLQEVMNEQDIVYLGAVEGPFTDAYTYIDTELFCIGLYEAPELIAHVMDCCALFSADIARVYCSLRGSHLRRVKGKLLIDAHRGNRHGFGYPFGRCCGNSGPDIGPFLHRYRSAGRHNGIRKPGLIGRRLYGKIHLDERIAGRLGLLNSGLHRVRYDKGRPGLSHSLGRSPCRARHKAGQQRQHQPGSRRPHGLGHQVNHLSASKYVTAPASLTAN
jgi:hypothetical protein